MEKQCVFIRKLLNLSGKAIAAFFVTFFLCSVLIIFTLVNRSNVERLTMEQLIVEKSVKINEVISKLLYKTHTVSALVIQNNGDLFDFERVAATIADDPAILNILIAPNGVVSNVYPLQGNEAVIGLDFFKEGAGNKEAVMARDKGELVFGGPFTLVQGGQALVGRLPVFMDSDDGGKVFWGLVSVTLKYPEALEAVGLTLLEKQGFAYEIWRINPDTNEKQIIANSDYSYNRNARYIEKYIPILNASWYCRISPVRHWYEYPETWLICIVALLVSILVAYVMQNNFELNMIKLELEDLARLDPLTGIFNRRYFIELAVMQMNKALRSNSKSFIVMFDLDFFKNVNDTYGHFAGDAVLKAVASNVKNSLRSYDIFARYGGEEFILLITEIDEMMIRNLAERIRKCILNTSVNYEGFKLSVSASIGVAMATPQNDLETAIKYADEALYKAKEEGRNKTVFYQMGDIYEN